MFPQKLSKNVILGFSLLLTVLGKAFQKWSPKLTYEINTMDLENVLPGVSGYMICSSNDREKYYHRPPTGFFYLCPYNQPCTPTYFCITDISAQKQELSNSSLQRIDNSDK